MNLQKNFESKTVRKVDNIEHIYVGHIPKEITQEQLKRLFQYCGTIVKLTRMENPITNEPSKFCFVEFDSIESVWRLMTLMNNIKVFDEYLTVKCPPKVLDLVNQWHQNRVYFLYKQNREWSHEEIEEGFLAAEENVKNLIHNYISEIQNAYDKKLKISKEANTQKKTVKFDINSRMGAYTTKDNKDTLKLNENRQNNLFELDKNNFKVPCKYEDRFKPLFPSSIIESEQQRINKEIKKKNEDMKNCVEMTSNWNDYLNKLLELREKRSNDRIEEELLLPSDEQLDSFIKQDINDLLYLFSNEYLNFIVFIGINNENSGLQEEIKLFLNDKTIVNSNLHRTNLRKLRHTNFKELKSMIEQLNVVDIKKLKNIITQAKKEHFMEWLEQESARVIGESDCKYFVEFMMDLLPHSSQIPLSIESVYNEVEPFLDDEAEQFATNLVKYYNQYYIETVDENN